MSPLIPVVLLPGLAIGGVFSMVYIPFCKILVVRGAKKERVYQRKLRVR
jgi:hypothetical protein